MTGVLRHALHFVPDLGNTLSRVSALPFYWQQSLGRAAPYLPSSSVLGLDRGHISAVLHHVRYDLVGPKVILPMEEPLSG